MKDQGIMVAEDYCIACEGKCTSDDPSDYDHMLVDWEGLSGAWIDRGTTPSDIWSFVASVLLSIARNNNLTWEEIEQVLRTAWNKGEED